MYKTSLGTIATVMVAVVAAVFCLIVPARADYCSDYRAAIDLYASEADAVARLNEATDTALKGARAARAVRSALRSLNTEAGRDVLEAADGLALLEDAENATATTIEVFELIHKTVKTTSDGLIAERAAGLEAARIAADAAAENSLDSLPTIKRITKRRALGAASAAAKDASVGMTGAATSSALLVAYENIYTDACES